MPQYEITGPDGRIIEIDGPTPPSEATIKMIFAQLDKPKAPAPKPPQTTGERIGGMTGTAVDVGIGALKGIGNTVYGMGKLVHDYTPIGRISDAIQPGAFDQRPPELEPLNTAQRIGHTAEQVGEFMVPSAAIAKLSKAGAVGRAVAQTKLQSDSPMDAALSGGLAAVMPGGSAAKRAAVALQEGAEKNVAQALGATKEWAKSEAAKIAPEMIERGIGGSRKTMLDLAKQKAAEAGNTLNAAYSAAAAQGDTVSGDLIRGSIQLSRDGLMTKNAQGALVMIPGTERVIKRLDKLDEFVKSLGPDIPVDKAAHIKRTWDALVAKAGLFGPKAAANATDHADAWAIREASNSFRELINRSPSLQALNAESAFWTSLKKVLKETEKRTQAQSGGLVSAGMGGAGVIAGAMSGDGMADSLEKAALGGLAARQLTKVFQSPWFKTKAAAPFKSALADALASGVAAKIEHASRRMLAALPAQAQ